MPVPMEEASRFGIVITDEDGRITGVRGKTGSSRRVTWRPWEFTFSSWKVLKEALDDIEGRARTVILESISFRIVTDKGERLFAYEYNGYWKDVGTLRFLLGSQYGTDRYYSGI